MSYNIKVLCFAYFSPHFYDTIKEMVLFGQKLKLQELIALLILFFLVLAIPLSVYLVKKQQIYKSKAAGNLGGKIGVQIVCNYPNQAEFESLIAQQPRVIKLMDDFSCAGRIKEISPSTFIVGRIYDYNFDDKYINDVIGSDPTGKAAEYVSGKEGAIAGNPVIDCWEGPNEPGTRSAEEMGNYGRFEAERVRRLAGMGRKACIGNFGVGHPDVDQWPSFYEAVGAARDNGGYLAVHEYGAPTMQCMLEGDTGWLTLRYRKAYRDYLQPNGLEIPLLITETGVDGGVCGLCGCTGGRGWRTVTDATSYAGELQWYKSKLDEDGYVVGATIFASGLPSWSDFDPYPEIIGPQGLLISYEGTVPSSPGTSAAPSSCNISYQSPNMGGSCSACLESKDSNLVSSIRNLNVSTFGSCSSLELINYWCNGGIGAQATNDCNNIKISCGQSCGGTTIPSSAPVSSPISTTSVFGRVWEDLDGNQTINGSEVPLEGIKVYLDSGLTSQATNNQGYYTFSSVKLGSHLVFLDLNDLDSGNWTLTTPSSVSVSVTAGSKARAAFGLRHPLSDSSPALTPSPSVYPSPSPTPKVSPSPRLTPSPTPRKSPTPIPTPILSPTPTPSSIPSPSPSPNLPASQVRYDLNRDNRINSVDRGLFLINWKSGDNFPISEFNGDGVINTIDYALLIRNFSL